MGARWHALVAAAVAGLLTSVGAPASSEGPEWTVADEPGGCNNCHLSAAGTGAAGASQVAAADAGLAESMALELEGLPPTVEAGRQYRLAIVLEDPELRNAGFLLTLRGNGAATGALAPADDRVEVAANQARSTWAGTFTDVRGRARWELIWTAPAVIDGDIRFDIWGNAGNDDLSPLGDRIHHRVVVAVSAEPSR